MSKMIIFPMAGRQLPSMVDPVRSLRAKPSSGRLTQGPERCAQLGTEELRLFPGCKVPAFVDLVVVDEFGIRPFRVIDYVFLPLARVVRGAHHI
jgi:hypothetical protein